MASPLTRVLRELRRLESLPVCRIAFTCGFVGHSASHKVEGTDAARVRAIADDVRSAATLCPRCGYSGDGDCPCPEGR